MQWTPKPSGYSLKGPFEHHFLKKTFQSNSTLHKSYNFLADGSDGFSVMSLDLITEGKTYHALSCVRSFGPIGPAGIFEIEIRLTGKMFAKQIFPKESSGKGKSNHKNRIRELKFSSKFALSNLNFGVFEVMRKSAVWKYGSLQKIDRVTNN